MKKGPRKRGAVKELLDGLAPRPFCDDGAPVTGGLISRPRPGLAQRTRNGASRPERVSSSSV